MADYAPIVRKILSENGCHLERQGKGDHEIWYSPLTKLLHPPQNAKFKDLTPINFICNAI